MGRQLLVARVPCAVPMFQPRRFQAHLAVVSLCRERAEWFDDSGGEVRHGMAPLEGEGAEAVVKAVEAARLDAGAKRRAVVLSLGDGILAHDLVGVPPLAKRELHAVFSRKASKLLDARPEDCAFRALAPNDGLVPGRGEERVWSLLAMRRSEIKAILLRMRDRGMTVRRVVSGRYAALETARGALHEPDSPAVLVGIEPASITLSLVRGEAVLNQDTIEGDFMENPAIASSLIHQVKSVIGYWKKESRGEVVSELVLFGLHPDRGLLLRHAFESALAGAKVHSLPEESDGEFSGRYAYFRAARVVGPFSPDLALPLPPRRATVTATVAFALLSVAGGGIAAAERLGGEARSLDAQAERLSEGTCELNTLRSANAQADATLADLRHELERLRDVYADGIPAEDVFAVILQAFAHRADLLELDIRRADGGHEVSVAGRVDADPGEVLAALGGLSRTLEGSPLFAEVELVLPNALPENGDGDARPELEFQIKGRLAGGQKEGEV